MSNSSLSGRRLALAEEMARAAGRAEAAVRSRGGEAAAPGDRFVLEATADWPVEWVLLEPQAEGFLAVPADVQPLVGGADIEVPAGSGAGALRLRCGFPVRLGAASLDPRLRAGAVDRITLEKARRKLREASPAARSEVDDSSEYRDWVRDTIAPAVAAAGGPVPSERERPARSGWPRAALVALAASWLLMVAGALAGFSHWRQGSASLEQERAAGRQALLSLKEGEERRIGRLEEEHRREIWGLNNRIARQEPAAPPAPEPLVLPAVRLYADDALRSEPKAVRLSAADRSLIVTLSLEETAGGPYTVRLTRSGTGGTVWRKKGLELVDGDITLEFPSELLPSGTYRFEIFGAKSGSADPLGRCEVTISR